MNNNVEVNGISVVVCCFNSVKKIVKTLDALSIQQCGLPVAFLVELLIIDNNSTDGTSAFVQDILKDDFPFPYRIILENNLGKTFALSRGINESKYKYVCIVDDDNWLNPDYLYEAWRILESDKNIGMVGGCGEPALESVAPVWFDTFAICYAAAGQAKKSGDLTHTTRFVYGAGSVLRKAAWERIHRAGFKFLLKGNTGNQLTSGEDNELCYALIIAGYKIWYSSELRFKHSIGAQRLNWAYIKKLYRAFAYTAATLMPYTEYFDRVSAGKPSPERIDKPLIWLRIARLRSSYLRSVYDGTRRDGLLRFKEGGFHSINAMCYVDTISDLITKQLKKDNSFRQVEKFINQINKESKINEESK